MKVLLFTHKSDIDGMGNVVLAKLAFREVDYVLCQTFNLQNKIKKYYDNKSIYNYDLILVTDLSLEEPTLSQVAHDEKLYNKFYVFDHHKSALMDNINKYDFVTLRIKDNNGLCSGTSLFYEWLVKNKYLIDKKKIKDFCELTRKYDTWEWKTKYNDEMPHKLSLLFDILGGKGYIQVIYDKLKVDDNNEFSFNELENMLINNKIEQVEERVYNYAQNVYYRQVLGLKAGIVFIDYEYRNDLAQYFRENNFDMDLAMLIALDSGSISYRSIKDKINVRMIAEALGGKGHDQAAASPISEEKKEALLKVLLEEQGGFAYGKNDGSPKNCQTICR